MADTIRERIIAAFTERAADLSTLPVERAQRSVAETRERFISIWDGTDSNKTGSYSVDSLEFPIALECIWQHGTDNPSVSANALLGEITTTLLKDKDRTFGGLASNTRRVSATINYPQDGSKYTSVVVTFLIDYETVANDPYTLID
jgi:hypothetical protein